MPSGADPPPILLPSAIFNDLNGMGYNANQRAFVNSQQQLVYMCAEKQANSDAAEWFWATNADAGINPLGQIPQLTADAIRNGSYNGATNTVTYSNVNYKFRLERDSNGVLIASAYAV